MTDKEQALQEYRQFRTVSRKVNDMLLEKLPKGAIEACGKELGVIEHRTLYLDQEEMSLFFDYCLYHHRTGGRNTIEAALADDLYPPGSQERHVLEVMSQAYPALFEVEGAEPGYGIDAYEPLRERNIFVMDQGFSHTATAGLVMGANLMPLSGVYVTSGAAFLLDAPALLQVEEEVERWERRVGEVEWNDLPAERRDRLATLMVRAALEHGTMSRMRYVDEDELHSTMQGSRPHRRPRKKR